MKRPHVPAPALAALLLAAPVLAGAEAAPATEFHLVVHDHRFDIVEVHAPAGQSLTFHVQNQDDSADEFEVAQLHKEKIMKGHGEATMVLPPLRAGKYDYMGELHKATAHGVLIVE